MGWYSAGQICLLPKYKSCHILLQLQLTVLTCGYTSPKHSMSQLPNHISPVLNQKQHMTQGLGPMSMAICSPLLHVPSPKKLAQT